MAPPPCSRSPVRPWHCFSIGSLRDPRQKAEMSFATVILYIAVSLTALLDHALAAFCYRRQRVADPTLRTTNWQKSLHRREK